MKLGLSLTSLLAATIFFGAALVATLPNMARADWDPVLEAEEAAQRKAAADAAAKQKAAAEAQKKAYTLKSQRTYLGTQGEGLADGEVEAAYNKKVAADQAKGLAAQREGMAMFAEGQQKWEGSRDKTNAAMKDMTGKSVDQLMNMSDSELEAFAAEMEKKMGNQ